MQDTHDKNTRNQIDSIILGKGGLGRIFPITIAAVTRTRVAFRLELFTPILGSVQQLRYNRKIAKEGNK